MAWAYPLGVCSYKGCEAAATCVVQVLQPTRKFTPDTGKFTEPETYNRCPEHIQGEK